MEDGGRITGTAKQLGLSSPAKITTTLGKYSTIIVLDLLSPVSSSSPTGFVSLEEDEEEGVFLFVQTNESNAKAISKISKNKPPKRYGIGDFHISTFGVAY